MLKRVLILVLSLFLFFPVLNVNALTYIRDTEQSVIWDKEDIISKEDKNILEEYNLKLSAGNYEAPKLQFALIGDSNIKTRPRDEEFKTIYDSWGLGKRTITNYSILLKGSDFIYVYFSEDLRKELPKETLDKYKDGVKSSIEEIIKDIRFNQVIKSDEANENNITAKKGSKINKSLAILFFAIPTLLLMFLIIVNNKINKLSLPLEKGDINNKEDLNKVKLIKNEILEDSNSSNLEKEKIKTNRRLGNSTVKHRKYKFKYTKKRRG
jgi:hypothetical protein